MPGPGPGPRGFGGGGPRGFGGPRFNRPFPHFNYNIPGASRNPGSPLAESSVGVFTVMQIEATEKIRRCIKRSNPVSGTITGLRVIMSGGIRRQTFLGRLATIDMQLSENRLTKEQALKRKMDAAKKYNRYLLKVGYLNREEYAFEMEQFARSINVQYIDDGQNRTRSR